MTHRIVTEALQALEALGATSVTCPAEFAIRMTVDPIPAVIRAPAYAQLGQAELIIDHLGDLVAHFAARATEWQRTALAALEENARVRTELTAARAEIERQREYIAGRDYDC